MLSLLFLIGASVGSMTLLENYLIGIGVMVEQIPTLGISWVRVKNI